MRMSRAIIGRTRRLVVCKIFTIKAMCIILAGVVFPWTFLAADAPAPAAATAPKAAATPAAPAAPAAAPTATPAAPAAAATPAASVQTDTGKAPEPEAAKPPEPKAPTCKYFRSGLILAAEVGEGKTIKVAFNKFDDDNLKVLAKRWKAVVYFRPDPERAISIYDYTIKTKAGATYPCVAVKSMDDDSYDGDTKWEVKVPDHRKIYSMLFLVDPPPPSDDDLADYSLVFELDKRIGSLIPLKFKNVKDGPFSVAAGIPETGVLDNEETSKAAFARAAQVKAEKAAAAAAAAEEKKKAEEKKAADAKKAADDKKKAADEKKAADDKKKAEEKKKP